MPKGGEIKVKVCDEDGHALFQISDTGPGLPPQILETLFTPSRSTKAGGTGLGLAITRAFCRLLGGDIGEVHEQLLAGVREFPVRIKCASLAWHTLKAALEKSARVSTE